MTYHEGPGKAGTSAGMSERHGLKRNRGRLDFQFLGLIHSAVTLEMYHYGFQGLESMVGCYGIAVLHANAATSQAWDPAMDNFVIAALISA